MNIGFISLGCAKNLVDSEYLIGLFDNPFFTYESDPKKCDVILVNTCGFILDAKEEAIDTILEMAELKKDRLKYLIVTGCFVERYYDDCLKEFPEVDAFIRIKDYPRIHEILSSLFKHDFKNCFGQNRKLITNSYTAYLKISDGCDNRCAYCAIPLIRGNCKSYKIEDIVNEAKRLRSLGVKELNVVAQDTTYYGKDIYNYLALKDLLVELDKIDFKWIRILYMYPDEIEDDLLNTMKSLNRVIPYFDIPIQYGNDTILKLMNRRGSVKLIKEKINKIRLLFPDAVIRTTLIIGFPNETEDTFNDTIDLVKELRFDSLGAFTFSREDDTKSFDMDNQVAQEDMEKRYSILMSEQNKIISDINRNRVGITYECLVERYESIFDRYVARAYLSAPDGIDGVVYIKSNEPLTIGEFYNVKINSFKEYDLYGELAK